MLSGLTTLGRTIPIQLAGRRSTAEGNYGNYNIEGRRRPMNKIRSVLYGIARLLGDVNAIKKGRVGRRIGRRAAGKITGRLFRKIFK